MRYPEKISSFDREMFPKMPLVDSVTLTGSDGPGIGVKFAPEAPLAKAKIKL